MQACVLGKSGATIGATSDSACVTCSVGKYAVSGVCVVCGTGIQECPQLVLNAQVFYVHDTNRVQSSELRSESTNITFLSKIILQPIYKEISVISVVVQMSYTLADFDLTKQVSVSRVCLSMHSAGKSKSDRFGTQVLKIQSKSHPDMLRITIEQV